MRVAWLSERYPPLPAQLRDLERVYGPVEVVWIQRRYPDAESLVGDLRRMGVRAAVVLLPLSFAMRLVELGGGIEWLWPAVRALHACGGPPACPEYDPERDALVPAPGGRLKHLRYVGLYRLKGVRLRLEPLPGAG